MVPHYHLVSKISSPQSLNLHAHHAVKHAVTNVWYLLFLSRFNLVSNDNGRQWKASVGARLAHAFNVKTVSPTYIAHFLAQDFSHFLRVFLAGVLLFTP